MCRFEIIVVNHSAYSGWRSYCREATATNSLGCSKEIDLSCSECVGELNALVERLIACVGGSVRACYYTTAVVVCTFVVTWHMRYTWVVNWANKNLRFTRNRTDDDQHVPKKYERSLLQSIYIRVQ